MESWEVAEESPEKVAGPSGGRSAGEEEAKGDRREH